MRKGSTKSAQISTATQVSKMREEVFLPVLGTPHPMPPGPSHTFPAPPCPSPLSVLLNWQVPGRPWLAHRGPASTPAAKLWVQGGLGQLKLP